MHSLISEKSEFRLKFEWSLSDNLYFHSALSEKLYKENLTVSFHDIFFENCLFFSFWWIKVQLYKNIEAIRNTIFISRCCQCRCCLQFIDYCYISIPQWGPFISIPGWFENVQQGIYYIYLNCRNVVLVNWLPWQQKKS